MIISIIAALSLNHTIGVRNTIPWHSPLDLAWFKKHTFRKPVIMGRRTFESIGQPLIERHNIILTRSPSATSGVTWALTPYQALSKAGQAKEVMIIGGGEVYQTFLPIANRLYLTYFNTEVPGDTWFPEYQQYNWQSRFRLECEHKESNINCCFEILDRMEIC